MIFYAFSTETDDEVDEKYHGEWEDEIGVPRRSIKVYGGYDYYLIEFSPEDHPKQQALAEIATAKNIPEDIGYFRVDEEARDWLYDWYQVQRSDPSQPILLITDRPPRAYDGEPTIRFQFGNVPTEEIPRILLTILSFLERDDLDGLRWEERKERLKAELPDTLPGLSTLLTLISIAP